MDENSTKIIKPKENGSNFPMGALPYNAVEIGYETTMEDKCTLNQVEIQLS